MTTRKDLRKRCRTARAAMDPAARAAASAAICRRLRTSRHYWGAYHVAFFWPMETEVDLRELMGSALAHGKRCYLPVMRTDGRLWFVRYRAGDTLRENRKGIPEPRWTPRDLLAPRLLDLVCMPLAGFDRNGTRLGLGGGYYDRTFDFRLREGGTQPRLVGVAFACQEMESIPREAWDVPLDAVVTERELVECRGAGVKTS